MASIRAVKSGQLLWGGVRLRINDKHVGVGCAVGVRIMIADIGDLRSIRRPDGVLLVVFRVCRQLVELVRVHVKEIEQRRRCFRRDEAFHILLEVVAINDDRLGLFFFFVLVFLFLLCFSLFVLGNSQEQ